MGPHTNQSWTEIFPVLDGDLVDEYEELATPEERAELEERYGIQEVFNRQDDKKHILSVSLFWKPMQEAAEDYPTPTRETLMNAKDLGVET